VQLAHLKCANQASAMQLAQCNWRNAIGDDYDKNTLVSFF